MDGPNIISVFKRLGWSIGDVQSRYIGEGEGGQDQFCGRIATGLSIHTDDFFLLPPHFAVNEDANVKNDVLLTYNEFKTILPNYDDYPKSFKIVIPYLIASLVYHSEFLYGHLKQNHQLFNNVLFRNNLYTRLKPFVKCGYRFCEITNMQATGIPCSFDLKFKINNMIKDTEKRDSNLKRMLNEELPQAITDRLLKRVKVDGAVSITIDDFDKFANNINNVIKTTLLSFNNNSNNSNNSNSIIQQSNCNENLFFTWGNRIHPVPENFIFPRSLPMKPAFDIYYFGCKNPNYAPYCNLKTFDLQKNDRQFLSKMKFVMEYLQEKHLASIIDIKSMSEADAYLKFKAGYEATLDEISAFKNQIGNNMPVIQIEQLRKINELSYCTIYDDIKAMQKAFDAAIEEEDVFIEAEEYEEANYEQ